MFHSPTDAAPQVLYKLEICKEDTAVWTQLRRKGEGRGAGHSSEEKGKGGGGKVKVHHSFLPPSPLCTLF